jgi:hypothetical protein
MQFIAGSEAEFLLECFLYQSKSRDQRPLWIWQQMRSRNLRGLGADPVAAQANDEIVRRGLFIRASGNEANHR